MIIDGKSIAADIYEETTTRVSGLSRVPKMTAITCAPNFETQKYLNLKKRKAAEVGIALNIVELPGDVSTEDAIACVERVAKDADGVVVQLPFPKQVDRERLLNAVPVEKDPDAFASSGSKCLSPVVGAIDEIASRHGVDWSNKNVVVVGHGRLVGKPAAIYATDKGAVVTVVTEETEQILEKLRAADVIISGVGDAHFITEDMVKEGVAVFDAGTSEEGGQLVGDVHSSVAEKASLFTPVPGGIGPITVAILLRNLVDLTNLE